MMNRFLDWVYDHPFRGFFVIAIFAFLIALFAGQFLGCVQGPPRRFENGDRTVFGPRTYGDVVEGDMAKPGPTQ